jgi:hypothetical protein
MIFIFIFFLSLLFLFHRIFVLTLRQQTLSEGEAGKFQKKFLAPAENASSPLKVASATMRAGGFTVSVLKHRQPEHENSRCRRRT